ncbi:DUF5704 domain-containing protein [Paenibacillus sp. DS2015]|uniref:DUF5704 domain-containing protein n=1 Tax=Paenibacillus sp. DS2015 TaxID=3373917 RepID=UPI003D19346C
MVPTVSAATNITPLKYHQVGNYRYFVGMFYYEMWRNSAGTWVPDGKGPNMGRWGEASNTYNFQFPNRKIKSISAPQIYIHTYANDIYFTKSRSDTYDKYERAVSLGGINNTIEPISPSGIGTDIATVPVTINMLLNADVPDDITALTGGNYADGVKGVRIYVPILFKIELASQLNVKYYTTAGRALNDIFPPRVNEEMIIGEEYTFTPPTHEDYEYVGFKKSTTDALPSGRITPGNPYSFNYDGSFEKYTAFMYYIKKGDPPPTDPDEPGGIGSCTWTIEPPRQIATPQTISMDPRATGAIKADDPSNSPYSYDVGQGIPTSDFLYSNTLGLNYLFQHTFGNQVGKINYDCSVDLTYVLTWKIPQDPIIGPDGIPQPKDDIEMSETEEKNYSFSFTRDYDYWTINNLEVYTLNKSTMSNYALPSGTVTLDPSGYIPPTLETENYESVEDHVYPKETGEISFTPPPQDGGYEKPSPDDHTDVLMDMAESQTQDADVQNDRVDFNGEIIMSDEMAIEVAPIPGEIPESPMIGDRVLYLDNQLISKTLINKANTPSSGTIFYDLLDGHVGGSGGKDYPINNINTVTVHTPVVNYSFVTDDEEHNQKTNPNYNRAAFILERPFTVRIPTEGQHVNYPGYGDRDYAKYYRTKQVWFPFDVYNGSRTQFIPKNTWIDIPVNQLDTAFYLPVWVDEGDYQVLFRNIAENAPVDFDVQPDANTELRNHVATDEISVEVIGRLYDFHITDIVDYNWETVFRTRKGSLQQTGTSYWVGMNSIDGDPRGNDLKFTVPIHPGSHPIQGFKNVAIKQGYHYKFDFKTKGNMFGPTDGIRITPTFNYVSKDGTMTTPVDLYYHASDKNFVKIGSNDDQVKRYVLLNERMRNVPNEELTDTAEFKYRNYYTSGQLINTSMNQFVENYINKSTKQKTPVGGYDLLLLPEQLRTFIGPKSSIPSSVNTDRALAAIQHWYGEYSIPADTYVVKKGIKLYQNGPFDEKASMFLKDGYIVVNFNIESIQQGDLANPHLQYINAPLMNKVVNGVQRNNQWRMEGFNHNIQDSYGNRFHLIDGDVVFYNANKSSRDDFGSQVPH